MRKKNLLIILLMSNLSSVPQEKNFPTQLFQSEMSTLLDFSPYMNTRFLSCYDQVRDHLIMHDHFKEVSFASTKNVIITSLFRQHPHAQASIIVLAGWLPGRVEGSASLVPLIPEEQFNLLLVNIRGHGKSTGHHPLIEFSHFGTTEYDDVMHAIEFLSLHTQKPIIIWGTCAGAFHAAHTVIRLSQQNLISKYNVKGLIFDSGWASVGQVSRETAHAMIKKQISKTYIRSSALALFNVIYAGFFTYRHNHYESTTNLYDKIQFIDIPVFYIHGTNDQRARFEHIQQLCKKTPHAYTWWIETSSHAVLQLKFKYQYRKKMLEFCNTVLSQS